MWKKIFLVAKKFILMKSTSTMASKEYSFKKILKGNCKTLWQAEDQGKESTCHHNLMMWESYGTNNEPTLKDIERRGLMRIDFFGATHGEDRMKLWLIGGLIVNITQPFGRRMHEVPIVGPCNLVIGDSSCMMTSDWPS